MTSEHKPPDPLLDLAGAVADGREIDWGSATESATAEERILVDRLRTLALVAEAQRVGVAKPPPASEAGPARRPDAESAERSAAPLFRWGHLEILEEIGAGHCSTIYRARDPELDHEVALKVLKPHGERAANDHEAIREARLMARVQHPNVARVHGVGEHDGHVGLWMELIHGQNLDEMLADRGPLGAAEVAGVGSCLCQAVSAVHQAGVLHRDIKTRNIMRETGGRFVLLDLGIGCDPVHLSESSWDGAGTPLFMAPEVMRGERATIQSDIYSLGVVLFRLLTETFPLVGKNWYEVRQAHAEGERRWLADIRPDLPQSLVRAIDRAIDPDPRRRYASAGEFEHALALPGVTKPRVPSWSKLLLAAALASMLVWLVRGLLTGYEIEANLYRLHGEILDPLTQHSPISPGDRLVLDLEASRPLHVYVVSHDDQGRNLLLFPLAGSHLVNPLPGGSRHRLPGTQDGAQLAWNVTSDGRQEHLVIVASPKPLDDFADDILHLPQAKNHIDPREAAFGRNMEGATGAPFDTPGSALGTPSDLAARLPEGSERSLLVEAIERLRTRSRVTRGVWVRQIDLEYRDPADR